MLFDSFIAPKQGKESIVRSLGFAASLSEELPLTPEQAELAKVLLSQLFIPLGCIFRQNLLKLNAEW